MVDEESLARDLRLGIGRVARRLRQLYTRTDDGLSFLELAVLQRLARTGPASPGKLAEGEQVTSAAIAPILRSLVASGLAERSPDPDDGRKAVVSISDSGRTTLAAREAASITDIHQALNHLTPAERRTLTEAVPLLERLATLL
ncbi:MarR family winged helix-turn-helix transcriptional regulator [Streptomyces sp. NPDC086766]|uniref:MarR family winged helix-turn-helix transcriptional regulator n=1 Tax=Streptomyces sp. NPDC086766 TaxID=3365754 RepID=UPI003816AB56